MPKKSPDVRAVARQHTQSAIDALARIMNDPSAPHGARVGAAQALIERGWGKPAEALGNPKPPRLGRRVTFRRIIVEPKH